MLPAQSVSVQLICRHDDRQLGIVPKLFPEGGGFQYRPERRGGPKVNVNVHDVRGPHLRQCHVAQFVDWIVIFVVVVGIQHRQTQLMPCTAGGHRIPGNIRQGAVGKDRHR